MWYRAVDLQVNCRKDVNFFLLLPVQFSFKRNTLLLCSKVTFLLMEMETVVFC